MTIASLAAFRLGDGCPHFSRCRARLYITSGMVTHTKTQLKAIQEASAAERGLALKALARRTCHSTRLKNLLYRGFSSEAQR